MSRNVDIHHGKIIPDDAPFLLFGKYGNLTINTEQTFDKKLIDLLELQDQEKINYCKTEIERVINLYFQRRMQECGISNGERNRALETLQKTNYDNITGAVQTLNYEAEAALFDAISVNPDKSWKSDFNVSTEYELIEKIKRMYQSTDIEKIGTFLDISISNHLPTLQAEKGPKRKEALAIVMDDIMKLYKEMTGKNPTHTVLKGAIEQELPQSKAGKLVVTIFDLVNSILEENNLSQIPPWTFKNQVRDATRRFREGKPLLS